jgi:hypothetical protein
MGVYFMEREAGRAVPIAKRAPFQQSKEKQIIYYPIHFDVYLLYSRPEIIFVDHYCAWLSPKSFFSEDLDVLYVYSIDLDVFSQRSHIRLMEPTLTLNLAASHSFFWILHP